MDTSAPETTEQTATARTNESFEVGGQGPAELEHRIKPKLETEAERIRSSITRLTSNSIGELDGLSTELQKLDDFIKFETDRVRREIDSVLSGIKIIVETIAPWKRSTVSTATNGAPRAVLGVGRSRDDARRGSVSA
jgi:hypothetical protein